MKIDPTRAVDRPGLVLSAGIGIRRVDEERAILRLQNIAYEEQWTQAQFNKAVEDVRGGYEETHGVDSENPIQPCLVVGESLSNRCPDVQIGQVILCNLEAVDVWNGAREAVKNVGACNHKVLCGTDGADMIAFLNRDGNRAALARATDPIYLVYGAELLCEIPRKGVAA